LRANAGSWRTSAGWVLTAGPLNQNSGWYGLSIDLQAITQRLLPIFRGAAHAPPSPRTAASVLPLAVAAGAGSRILVAATEMVLIRGRSCMRFTIWTAIPTILLAACAATPTAPSAPAATAKAPVAAAPVAVATTAGATAPAAKLTSDQLRDAARHAGYQLRTIKGQQVYCRDETPVGTRFPQSVCLSETDLAIRAEINQGVKDQMRAPTSLDPAR
jgi:hypothetical protein